MLHTLCRMDEESIYNVTLVRYPYFEKEWWILVCYDMTICVASSNCMSCSSLKVFYGLHIQRRNQIGRPTRKRLMSIINRIYE